jgi:hypothetical protein
MPLQGYLKDLFDGAGPSSGPKYAELESAWLKLVDQEGGE